MSDDKSLVSRLRQPKGLIVGRQVLLDIKGAADAIERLTRERDEARAALASARNDALEEAAKWHDEQHAENAIFRGLYMSADIGGMHARFAAAIRAMKREPADD